MATSPPPGIMTTEHLRQTTTPPPGVTTSMFEHEVSSSSPELTDLPITVNQTVHDGDFAAIIGGSVCVVLLLLIITLAVLLWCLSRYKGSYATNETEGYVYDEDEDEDDDESFRSDTALQSKEPLQIKEEE